MKKKYRNKLPKGAEVKGYIAHVDNGEIVVEVELKDRFQPKDGDFLVSAYDCVFIYSDKEAETSDLYCCYCGEYREHLGVQTTFSDNWTEKKGCRFATPEKKSAFLEKLESEAHLRWNAETKKLEPIRWRAKFTESYFVVTNSDERDSFIVKEKKECFSIFDEENYQLNNYFRTPEAAQKVADQIINIFKNSKAE